MRICFDMDGTIANLYGVENWLDYLVNENVKPYRDAQVMLNMNSLAKALHRLQRAGHEVVIISWLSKCGSDNYDKAVTETKKAWLKKHLGSVQFDEINIVKYGTEKSKFCKSSADVLFDDEKPNRDNWAGRAYDVQNILEVLASL